MKITFEAEHGCRILRNRWMGITTYRKDDQPSLWWCYRTKKWVTSNEKMPDGGTSHAPCKSYKAFLRHLRKHPELKGYEVTFVSRYIGYNITAEV